MEKTLSAPQKTKTYLVRDINTAGLPEQYALRALLPCKGDEIIIAYTYLLLKTINNTRCIAELWALLTCT